MQSGDTQLFAGLVVTCGAVICEIPGSTVLVIIAFIVKPLLQCLDCRLGLFSEG